jgi:hypothetical protein
LIVSLLAAVSSSLAEVDIFSSDINVVLRRKTTGLSDIPLKSEYLSAGHDPAFSDQYDRECLD